MSCPRPHLNFLRSPSARQTLTTLVIAVGSTIVLTLVGCASPSGIAPSAKLAAPAVLGADATTVVAPR